MATQNVVGHLCRKTGLLGKKCNFFTTLAVKNVLTNQITNLHNPHMSI